MILIAEGERERERLKWEEEEEEEEEADKCGETICSCFATILQTRRTRLVCFRSIVTIRWPVD